jgi:hypothetical protein
MPIVINANLSENQLQGTSVGATFAPFVSTPDVSYPINTAVVPGTALDADLETYNVGTSYQFLAGGGHILRGSEPQVLLSAVSSDSRIVYSITPNGRDCTPAASAELIASNVPVIFNFNLTMTHAGGSETVPATANFIGSKVLYEPLVFKAGTTLRAMADVVQATLGSTARNIGNARVFEESSQWQSYEPSTWNLARRNTTNPLHSVVDLGPFSFLGQGAPATLISPRYILMANHWQAYGTIGFLSMDNVLQTATVLRVQPVPGVSDGAIGYLSAPITNVTPASILAARIPFLSRVTILPPDSLTKTETFETNLGKYSHGSLVFTITVRSLVPSEEWIRKVGSNGLICDADGVVIYSGRALNGWQSTGLGGDSGSPLFAKLAGKTVLLSQYYVPGAGSNWAGKASSLNSLMNSMKDEADSTVYAVDTV